jgi:hypothetical protein
MFTTAAYYEASDGAAVLHNIAAVNDPHLTTNGDDIRVPNGMNNLVGHAILSAADAALTDARLLAPSLRRICNIQIGVLVNAIVFGNPPEGIMHPMLPTPLIVDESLQLQINSDEAADTAVEIGLVWFSDGQLAPVYGDVYTVRATAAITESAGVWVNGNLTFDQTLAVGEYEIIGMRAQSSNGVCARLVFVGSPWRPGVPMVNAKGDIDCRWFRYGRLGSLGRFHSTNPPTLDVLGVTSTAQVIWLDLLKVG